MWKAHSAADKAAAAAAAASGSAEADAAEALLEQQLEQMLDEGAHHDDDSLMDDYLDSEEPSEGSSTASGDTGSDSDGSKARRGKGTGTGTGRPQQQQRHQQPGGKHGVQAVAEPPPPSFSGVQLDLPQAELRRRFPRFPGLAAAAVVVLQAGDMLYLPAGWFHEVTSYGGPGEWVGGAGAAV